MLLPFLLGQRFPSERFDVYGSVANAPELLRFLRESAYAFVGDRKTPLGGTLDHAGRSVQMDLEL